MKKTPFIFQSTHGLSYGGITLRIMSLLKGDAKKQWVPAYRFSIERDADRANVGEISLRVGMNPKLYPGGQIGYGVNEEYRGNGYAFKACMALMPLCRRHNMSQVYITCNPDNAPSRRTIEKLEGARLVEIITLDPLSELYLRGDREKCIFLVPVPPQE